MIKIVGKHKANLSVLKSNGFVSEATYDRCWMFCSFTNVPPFSPAISFPCWYGENQWLLYSEEGLMSTNEILSAMSHSSDSY